MALPSDLDHQFQMIIECLERHRVRYVVIGGVAAMLHDIGIEETLDVDIVVERETKNLRALANALKEMEARLRVPDDPEGIEISLDDRTFKGIATLTFVTRFGPFDVLFEPAGVPDYEALRSAADMKQRFGIEIPVASVDSLIAMKRATGRQKDAEHLIALLDYLRRVRSP